MQQCMVKSAVCLRCLYPATDWGNIESESRLNCIPIPNEVLDTTSPPALIILQTLILGTVCPFLADLRPACETFTHSPSRLVRGQITRQAPSAPGCSTRCHAVTSCLQHLDFPLWSRRATVALQISRKMPSAPRRPSWSRRARFAFQIPRKASQAPACPPSSHQVTF